MARQPGARLQDNLEAIARIDHYRAGRPASDYRNDEQFRDALERNIERISEASRHIPAELKEQHPEIPWQDIAAIGNILRHAYDRVSSELIWEVLEGDLEPLEKAVSEMLTRLHRGTSS